MNGLIAEIDPNAAEARAEASGGSGKFPPLPKGNYQAIVVPIKSDGSITAEVKDFGGTGANSQKKVLRVALKIIDESPTGAKRVLFDRVPLFTRYAPTQKNPQGATARNFWGFFEGIGWSGDDLLAGKLPTIEQIMGRRVTIVVSEPNEPDDYNPLGFNEISFYNKPETSVAGTPKRAPGTSVAPWLDADDNIKDGYQFASDAARALYNVDGEVNGVSDATYAAATADPWATPAATQAPAAAANVTAGPWGNQPTGGLQAAADAAVGM